MCIVIFSDQVIWFEVYKVNFFQTYQMHKQDQDNIEGKAAHTSVV